MLKFTCIIQGLVQLTSTFMFGLNLSGDDNQCFQVPSIEGMKVYLLADG